MTLVTESCVVACDSSILVKVVNNTLRLSLSPDDCEDTTINL